MSKICVKSRRTNSLLFIPVHLIESVYVDDNGHTNILRTGKERIRVYESLERVQEMIQQAYGHVPQQPVVQQQVVQQRTSVVVQQPYRPQSRSNKVVDTALGVGLGVVGAELVGEAIDAIFDIDFF